MLISIEWVFFFCNFRNLWKIFAMKITFLIEYNVQSFTIHSYPVILTENGVGEHTFCHKLRSLKSNLHIVIWYRYRQDSEKYRDINFCSYRPPLPCDLIGQSSINWGKSHETKRHKYFKQTFLIVHFCSHCQWPNPVPGLYLVNQRSCSTRTAD